MQGPNFSIHITLGRKKDSFDIEKKPDPQKYKIDPEVMEKRSQRYSPRHPASRAFGTL